MPPSTQSIDPVLLQQAHAQGLIDDDLFNGFMSQKGAEPPNMSPIQPTVNRIDPNTPIDPLDVQPAVNIIDPNDPVNPDEQLVPLSDSPPEFGVDVDRRQAQRDLLSQHKSGIAQMESEAAQRQRAEEQADLNQRASIAKSMGFSDEQIAEGLGLNGQEDSGEEPVGGTGLDEFADPSELASYETGVGDFGLSRGLGIQDDLFAQRRKIIEDYATIGQAKAKEQEAFHNYETRTLELRAQEDERRLVNRERQKQQSNGKLTNMMEDLHKMEVEPDRFWEKKGTAGRIGMAIAIGLASFGKDNGAGAMRMLRQAIEDDVQAQKVDILNAERAIKLQQRKHNDLLDSFASEDERIHAKRVLAYEKAKIQFQRTMATFKGQEMQLRGQELLLKIDAEQQQARAEYLKSVEHRIQLHEHRGGRGADAARLGVLKEVAQLPEEHKLGMEELNHYRSAEDAAEYVAQKYEELDKIHAKMFNTPGGADQAQLRTTNTNFFREIKQALKGERFTDNDFHVIVEPYFVNKIDRTESIEQKKKQLIEMILNGAPTPVLDRYGLSPKPKFKKHSHGGN